MLSPLDNLVGSSFGILGVFPSKCSSFTLDLFLASRLGAQVYSRVAG